jgi:hypothetical protein
MENDGHLLANLALMKVLPLPWCQKSITISQTEQVPVRDVVL